MDIEKNEGWSSLTNKNWEDLNTDEKLEWLFLRVEYLEAELKLVNKRWGHEHGVKRMGRYDDCQKRR